MGQFSRTAVGNTIGIDLGDRKSVWCEVDRDGEIVGRGSAVTSIEGFRREFEREAPARVVIEAGTHSPWASEALGELGHEVLVANPRRLPLIYGDVKKNDSSDAEKLARVGRMDADLLKPINHRSRECQADLAVVQARRALVDTRTRLILQVRSILKNFGHRAPGSSAECFPKKVIEFVPESLLPALEPLLVELIGLNKKIALYDRRIEWLGKKKYPETEVLRQVAGVGPLISLVYVLVLEDPERFTKSRAVGAFLGLTPRQDQSGEQNPQLRITKAGHGYLRQLLVGSAHYVLGRHGPDCDLRRYGEKIAARGGTRAKKRAAVAVARKLAVLLHQLWLTQKDYEPLRWAKESERKSA